MKKKIIGIFVVGILIITGFASIPTQAGPALQPVTSPDPQIIDMMQQVNASLLYEYLAGLIAFGPRVNGSMNCTRAAEYLYSTFDKMGLDVYFQEWHINGIYGKNVVATLPGTDVNSTAEYILCAHYDSFLDAPGAIDDGAGVAAVLATAKILSQHSFTYTVRFIAFDGEENGMYGSYTYARDASQRGDNIVAVINLDQIGYAITTEGGRVFQVFVPERSKWLGDFITTVNTLYRNQTNMTVVVYPNGVNSDELYFIGYGFDAARSIHTDLDQQPGHTPNDTIDKVNFTYLTKETKLTLAVITELASTPLELQVIITKPIPGYFYFFNLPLLRLSSKTNLYIGIPFIVGYPKLYVDAVPYGDINRVYFCIDGNINSRPFGSAPHYEWMIYSYYFSLFGRHNVEVYASTTSGKVASDEMDIFFIAL
jgi:Peptidase family M28